MKWLLEFLAETEDPKTFLYGFRALVEADKVNLAAEAQALRWLEKQPPEGDEHEQEPVREIVVRTREEAAVVCGLSERTLRHCACPVPE
jgi:hypothetical protein